MSLETARIPARTRRQAMDWSLVLASQEIEHHLEGGEDGAGWGLVVAAPDYQRALNALHLYQLENRRWRWRQEVFSPGVLFDWGSLAWASLIALFYVLDMRLDLRPAGWLLPAAVTQGQWWRLFTALWLHADLGHFASNAGFGFVLVGLTLGRYGTGVGLLAACLAGVGGNLVRWLIMRDTAPSLGASGLIMGCMGLLAVQALPAWGQTRHSAKVALGGILGGVMLFVLLGLSPGTDILAHAGGFLSGLLLGGVAALLPNLAHRPRVNAFCGFLFAVLVVWPWWLALRHAP